LSASDETVLQVDGVPATGDTGLTALGAKSAGTRVWAAGTFDRSSRSLSITYVEAGYGTLGNGQDIALGLVTARSGASGQDATLTVQAATIGTGNGNPVFNQSITVNAAIASSKARLFKG